MSNFTRKADFKTQRSFGERLKGAAAIRAEHPDKIPVVIQRYWAEKTLSDLEQVKFLVPKYCTMSDVIQCIRQRLSVPASKSLYVIVNDRSLVSNTSTLCEIYELEKDEDGFLYMHYASEETFG